MDIVISSFGRLVVVDEHSHRIELRSLWQQKTAVIVFVRHFGWVFCRQQVADLANHQNDFNEKGGSLVVIGNGRPEQLAALRAATGYRGILLADPERKTYTFLGLNRSLGGVFGLKMLTRAVRSIVSGYRPGALQGDALQLGGAVTVTVDNRMTYFFKSTEAGEHPPIADLLASLDHPWIQWTGQPVVPSSSTPPGGAAISGRPPKNGEAPPTGTLKPLHCAD